MGRGKFLGRPDETLGGNLAIHLHPIQKNKWYSLSFQNMKTEISSSWVGHLASKQSHAHVSSNIPLPNVTAETRLLRSGLTTDELLDAKKRKKILVWIQVKNSSPFWYVIIAKFAWNTINANFNTCTLLSLPVLSCTWYKIKKIFSKFIQCVFLLLWLNMVKIKNEQDYLKFSVYKYTVYCRVYVVVETTLHQMIYEQFKGGVRIIHLPQPFQINISIWPTAHLPLP